MTQRKARTLTNREAGALYGEGWECSETGMEVWQRIAVEMSSPAATLLVSEEQARNRASRLLRRHRLAAEIIVEQLQTKAESLAFVPFARLIAGKNAKQLREEARQQQERVDAIPKEPTVHRLDPDAASNLPADSKKLGSSIWYFDKRMMMVFSREITKAVVEKLDDVPTLIYETSGAMPDGGVVRRSCAHHVDGIRVLCCTTETAFVDPIAAREHLNRQKPPPEVAPPAKAAPAPAAKPVVEMPVQQKPAPVAAPKADPIADHGFDESLAVLPFDESMLDDKRD